MKSIQDNNSHNDDRSPYKTKTHVMESIQDNNSHNEVHTRQKFTCPTI